MVNKPPLKRFIQTGLPLPTRQNLYNYFSAHNLFRGLNVDSKLTKIEQLNSEIP